MYTEINECRICSSQKLKKVFSLGEQCLTGYFPSSKNEFLPTGPVDLVFCESCGLLQLLQSYNLSDMYGENYGYRSGLNISMVNHLSNKIRKLEKKVVLSEKDLVIDIGSNDATSLKSYTVDCQKVGIDPTGVKFFSFYPEHIKLIPDFFSADVFYKHFSQKAKIITSIAMFYDLPAPDVFVKDIKKCLAEGGIWHFEQSYMPLMLKTISYDTLCQEHLEFYSLSVIYNLLRENQLKIIDIEINDINGGSIAITASHDDSSYDECTDKIRELLNSEKELKLDTVVPYLEFANKCEKHKNDLRRLLLDLKRQNKKVFGYGASTKGNVLLQYCEITSDLLPYIAEVNKDKFGCYTPATNIPIISEEEARSYMPDYFLVLPWHFKNFILDKEKEYREKFGVKFIFPLPDMEII